VVEAGGNTLPAPRRVREFGTITVEPEEILLNGRLNIYPALKDSGYIELAISPRATQVRARGHIGIIPINDHLTLEVVPRVSLGNLARMLELSSPDLVALAGAARSYDAEGELYPSLAALYARGLGTEIDRIIELGLLKEYQRVEEVSSFPHGRIEVGRTMALAARGITHKAAVTWHQRSVDNPANRCLLYAVWSLSQYVDRAGDAISKSQQRSIRRHLNWAWHRLGGVELDVGRSFLADGVVTGAQPLPTLRSYYRQALDLALTIIKRRGIRLEESGSALQLSSVVISMSDVFEDYLREVLVLASQSDRWALRVLDGNAQPPDGGASRLFAEPGAYVKATPDIVLQRADSTVPLVVEVKYKPAEGLPKREDLNQAITYGFAYGASHVVLAQPRAEKGGRPPGMHSLGEISGLQVSQYVSDLAGDLAVEESAFAASMRTAAGA
jgi:5-methylcytosine-specific restriction enzyme subunit McrC